MKDSAVVLESVSHSKHRRNWFSKKHVIHFLTMFVRIGLVICICYVILFPLYNKIILSFMNEKDLYDPTVKYIPKNFTLKNYIMVFQGLSYMESFRNSLLLSGAVSILTLISTTMVGYGFARFHFPLEKFWFFLVILTLLIPSQTILVPLYVDFRFFDLLGITDLFGLKFINMIGTAWPQILMSTFCMGFKNGLYIFLMRQCFRGIPRELEEAAYIDGSGVFRTFRQIVLPSVRPMMITIFLLSFVWQWTETNYASLLLTTRVPLLATKLQALSGVLTDIYKANDGTMNFISHGFTSICNSTGSVFLIAPLVLVYLFCQRYFIEGIERSGIVG